MSINDIFTSRRGLSYGIVFGLLALLCSRADAQPCYTQYSLSPSGTICGQSTTVTMSGSQTGVTYQLEGNSGGNIGSPMTGTGSALTWTNVPVTGGGTYVVAASGGGYNCSANVVASTSIFGTPFPGGSVVASCSVVSSAYPVTLTYVPSGNATEYTYQWFSGPPISGSTQSVLTVTAPSQYGNYSILVSANSNGSSCGSTMFTAPALTTTPFPPPTAPSGTTTRCQAAASTAYTTSATSNPSSYTWSISPSTAGTISGSGTTGTVSWSAGFSGTAVVTVAANNCSGPSSPVSTSVTVSPAETTPGAPSGSASICQGVTSGSYLSSASNATSYVWSISPSTAGSISGTSTTGTVSWNTAFSGTATIGVSSVGCSGTSTQATTAVTVHGDAGAPSAPGGNNQLCQGSPTATYTTSAANATSYVWSISPASAGTISGTGTSGAVSLNAAFSGTATIGVSSVGCNGTSAAVTTAVTVVPTLGAPATPAGATSVIQGTSGVAYATAGSVGGFGYTWSMSPVNAGTIAIVGNPLDAAVNWNMGFVGQATVTVTAHGCTGSTLATTVPITVYPMLNGGDILSGNVTIAPGTSPGQIVASPASGGMCSGSYTYQWLSSSTGTAGSFVPVTTGSSGSAPNYSPGNLSATTYYEREVTCANSGSAYTDIISVAVGNNPYPGNLNYIRTREVTRPGIANVTSAAALTAVVDVKQTTEYFEELGRPWETVGQLASNMQGDMVTMHVYDPMGNEASKYLPYAASTSDGSLKLNAAADQNAFYSTLYPAEGFYFQQTSFEASPLARQLANYAPGNSWLGSLRGTADQYEANTATDAVQEWFVTNSGTPGVFGSYSTSGTYPAGSLFKHVSTDEQGHQVIEFKDLAGRVILKKVQLSAAPDNGSGSGYAGWLSTYYIYDDLDNLRCVIQPNGVALLIANSWNISALSNAILNEQCFRYEYDQRNRMITKQTPGTGAVYMVYDNLDRLVMTQDANMRVNQQWLVTLYENALDRSVGTGLYTTTTTFASLLSAAAGVASYPFTASSTPTSGWELLTVTHYDNYTGMPAAVSGTLNTTAINMSNFYSSTNTSPQYAMPMTQSTPSTAVTTMGLVTWTQAEALDGTHSVYISTANIYDSRARLIQRQSTNYSGGLDLTTTQYSFVDKPLIVDQRNQKVSPGNPTQTYEVATRNTYDALERLTEVDKMVMASGVIATPAWEVVSTMSYDALGRLTTKKIGNSAGSTPTSYKPLETQAYDYNIRSWLLGINRNYINSSLPTNFFGFELGYDNANTIVPATTYANPQFNGNISGMVWKNGGDGVVRKYDYTYDAVNRLMTADFNDYSGTSFNRNDGLNFSVNAIGYDANGNLLGMNQQGWNGSTSGLIDELLYNYIPYTNRLLNVQDQMSNATTVLGDFRYSQAYTTALGVAGKTPTTVDYGYDGNGNLTSDKNKDITSIAYNFLNLPQTVNVSGATAHGTISYLYDAAGDKLVKTVSETGATVAGVSTTITTTDNYVEGFVYETRAYGAGALASQQYTDKLQYFGQEEGRVRALYVNSSSPNTLTGFAFDYYLKDHLGNTRTVVTEEAETDPYPTLTFDGTGTTITNQNAVWDNASGQSINVASRQVSPLPTGFTATANGTYCGSITKAQGAIGAAKLLKVMAGDQLNVSLQVTYSSATVDNSTANGLNTLAGSLAAMMLGSGQVSSVLENQASTIASSMPTVTNVKTFFSPETSTTSTTGPPEAYLHVLLFNDQMVFDNVNSVVMPVTTSAQNAMQTMTKSGLVIPRSGYAYIYFSNESNTTVYFDNFMLTDVRGPILEMDGYYPFGLAMAGISDKAMKTGYAENKHRYNGKELQHQEFSDGSGLEEYDYGARFYDLQIGRWQKTDGKAELYFATSPYVYALDQPTNATDPNGNLVIFVNGFNFGFEGGSASYWTATNYYTIQQGKNAPAPPGYHLINWSTTGYAEYGKDRRFDEEVMDRLDDHHAMYKDGSLGGILGLFNMGISNLSASDRYSMGLFEGKEDAKNIIDNLARDKNGNIIETIKVIAHSMGAEYAKGYIQSILDYAKAHNIVGVIVEFEADFAPYQPTRQKAVVDKNMGPTYQFSHKEHVAGDKQEPGAEKENTSKDASQSHSIFSFFQEINNLPQGHYHVVNGQIVPNK